ncbi:MAG: protein kinase family protein [Cyanobacteria bacterium SZAS LIN-3]|nr:protein kinase family protein [Cyanobacteria bacterium SZAS LIN-3]
MSLAEEDTDALLKRKHALDSTVMSMTVAGIEVPAEMELEFIAVQQELIRRGRNDAPLVARNWTSWLGKKIGEYTIDYMIEEGLYWYLFHATYSDESAPAMIKVSKSSDCYGVESGKIRFPTRLFAIDGDFVREVQPAQNAIIEAEVIRMTATVSDALPVIDEESRDPVSGVQYYRCPYYPGDTLRDLLNNGDGPEAAFGIVSMFSQIAGVLDELSQQDSFAYHGNLKPENIGFTASGVMFRELGDFGPLRCTQAMESEVRITTPQYYPWLDADDIGALGICLWEALIGYHPFDDARPGDGECMISQGLRALVELELSLANIFILPLLSIKRPHQLGIRTSEKLETLLFKSIKLKVGEDGQIHEDPGYQSMTEFNEELLDLLNESQMIF